LVLWLAPTRVCGGLPAFSNGTKMPGNTLPGVFIMPEPVPSPATHPAPLRIDGPIATITPKRPAAFQFD
jgi:hypothetical protein